MTKNAQSGREDGAHRIFRRTSTVDPHAGLGAIARITRMSFRYPVLAGLALVATMAAVFMQLSIPVILGRAVDQTQAVAASNAALETLYPIATLLFCASVARGIFTLIQNYIIDADFSRCRSNKSHNNIKQRALSTASCSNKTCFTTSHYL
jgi:ABC-type multidrug transport system fused ATPase/permease subunit